MNNKIITLGLILTFIAPQVASAAWWNPFSWNIFNKKDQKTLMLENQVKELENRLNNKESQIQEELPVATSSTKIEITRPPVVNKTVPKGVTVQPSTQKTTGLTSTKTSVEVTVNTDDLFNTINIKINKLFDIKDSFKLLESTPNITKGDKNLIFTKQTEINSVINNATQDKTNYTKIIAQSTKSDLNKNITYLNSLIADLDIKISNFNNDYTQIKTNIPKNIAADTVIFVSDKEDRLKAVNLEIAQLNTKHAADIEKANSAGGTMSGVETTISNITRLYQIEYNKLQAKYQLIKYGN